jgi:hypothetical protein
MRNTRKPTPGNTKLERARFFAGGRATVGTIGTFNKRKREFSTRFVGKVRGRIITGENGQYKFRSRSAALNAAQWFLSHAKREAGLA